MNRFVRSALALSCGSVATVQANENQLWTSIGVTGPISSNHPNLLLWFDGHARSRNDADSLGVTIFRPGLGWRVSDRVDLWAGYARVVGRRDNLSSIGEDRFWQQATYAIGPFASGKVSGRTRLEQRFRDAGSGTGWRLRQLLSYARPFERNPDWSLVVSNETFIGLNDATWGQRSGYDQNRAFLGFSFKHTPNITTTAGYLNNHLDLGAAGTQTNHNLALSVSFGL